MIIMDMLIWVFHVFRGKGCKETARTSQCPSKAIQHPAGRNGLGISDSLFHFSLFFPKEVIRRIVDNTNLYALEKGARIKTRDGLQPDEDGRTGRYWYPLTSNEFRIWFGITMLMGVDKSPKTEDYWRKPDGCSTVHPFDEHISLGRFQQIKRYLHISRPEASDLDSAFDESEDITILIKKVHWLFEHFRKCCKSFRASGSRGTVDGSMTVHTGKTQPKHFIGKPICKGYYRMFVTTEGGYVYDCYPKTPSSKQHNNTVGEVSTEGKDKQNVEISKVRAEYPMDKPTSRSWMLLFSYVGDTVMGNSYIIYKVRNYAPGSLFFIC